MAGLAQRKYPIFINVVAFINVLSGLLLLAGFNSSVCGQEADPASADSDLAAEVRDLVDQLQRLVPLPVRVGVGRDDRAEDLVLHDLAALVGAGDEGGLVVGAGPVGAGAADHDLGLAVGQLIDLDDLLDDLDDHLGAHAGVEHRPLVVFAPGVGNGPSLWFALGQSLLDRSVQ